MISIGKKRYTLEEVIQYGIQPLQENKGNDKEKRKSKT